MFGSFMLKGITRLCVQCLAYVLFIMHSIDISNDKVIVPKKQFTLYYNSPWFFPKNGSKIIPNFYYIF